MQNVFPLPDPARNAASEDLARPDRTVALTRGVTRLFIDLGLSPLCEFRLANGRRADVAGLDRRGKLVIAEVKSCRADFEVDQKWPDYLAFCDQFYFAVDPDFPRALLPESEGLIVADDYGAAIARAAEDRPLNAARRKAVTLRFARQAAAKALSAPVLP
ncbi:MmcB family DNA repair protein [Hyphococcus luteus]|uniref:DNA repair protein MmcB-related protein n=1 Tax=Hyphococcus luteus TaxID=2058213 RepID=A0A2S7K8Q3_9PROT|nr:MmcB family DNA repair protein [Marinicaulis flavus]PQA88839.1 DNA repair protein MmcB-related protein [Marinicaulis flavus]